MSECFEANALKIDKYVKCNAYLYVTVSKLRSNANESN